MSGRGTLDAVTREGQNLRRILALAVVLAAALAAPSTASAELQTETFRLGPIQVDGYEVLQGHLLAETPKTNGHIVAMEVDVTDAEGNPIPIQRLMLHHIVFTNLARRDATCDQFTMWDGHTVLQNMPQRFYGAGEERAKLAMPPGYGYPTSSSDPWGVTYMFMNHRGVTDEAYISYTVTVDTNPDLAEVEPYWLDVKNCQSDPIYNVPGTGKEGSTHAKSADFTFPRSGRILGGGGHVHGGANQLTLSQPDCGDREFASSSPTWGNPDHPFYNVKPILHEPGPISMSRWWSPEGVPVTAGQRIRLSSEYENSLPHARVMGISVVLFAPDPSVTDGCAPLGDVVELGSEEPGRSETPEFEVPLTGLDKNGKAVEIDAPPGKLERMGKGGEVIVGDRFFAKPNIEVKKGAEVEWRFAGSELHNVTLANGPKAIGSPNLNDDRTFSEKFKEKGTYRLFCGLHPVDMQNRVVVRGKNR
jgi:plastocyanin